MILSYGGKLIIGLGAWGLIVGPYASINTSLGKIGTIETKKLEESLPPSCGKPG